MSTQRVQQNLGIFLEQLKALGVDTLYMPPDLLEAALSAPAAKEMDALEKQLHDCQLCKLHKGRKNLVFGAGNAHADLVFVGEAPGHDEDQQGKPFVGKAGELLTQMITAMGVTRDDVYICNVVKCRPPNNRNPELDEIAACEPFLVKQLEMIQPKVIVCMGKFAAQTLLQTTTAISRLRGTWQSYNGIKVMPIFHPAYLLRNAAEKRVTWEDLQLVMKELGLKKPS